MMTRDEIMAMDAAQLRLAIARAKGWERFLSLDGHMLGRSPDGTWFDSVPDWPNDISAAWELVEEMGKSCKVHVSYYAFDTKWYCSTIRVDEIDDVLIFFAKDDTAPLAICRAWLLWKAAL